MSLNLRRFVRKGVIPAAKRLSAPIERELYSRLPGPKRLNIGAGANLPRGWLNTDLKPRLRAVYMDASKPWPFAADTFDLCLCEHMIEHIPKSAAAFLFQQAFRVLKPGGVLRVVTPDVERLARLLLGPDDEADRVHRDTVAALFGRTDFSYCDLINSAFYEHGHRYLYTRRELGAGLAAAGFTDLATTRAVTPCDLRFEGAEGHERQFGREVAMSDGFAIEATKPAPAVGA